MIAKTFRVLAISAFAVLTGALTVVTVALTVASVYLTSLWLELPPLEGLGDAPACATWADDSRCLQVKVRIEQVPVHLKQAIIAAADMHFYERRGILGGFSPITAHLARYFFRLEGRQLRRLLSEVLLLYKIDLNFSKDQILELYINHTYLGHAAYGFEAAAQTYFGKSLDDLTLAETAMLAGVPKAPSLFNPVVDPPRAKARQKIVLERMLKAGVISEPQCQQALEETVRVIIPNSGDAEPVSDVSSPPQGHD